MHRIAQDGRQREIRDRLRRPCRGDGHPTAGGHGANRPVHRERLRHAAAQKETGDSRGIARRRYRAAREQGLDLRRDAHRRAVVRVVQRLDPVRIAREEHRSRALVPDAEREHSAKLRQHRRSVAAIKAQQHFRIGRRLELLACRGELVAQLAVVVDLAVEHDRQIAFPAVHRLIGAIADIDDRQTAVSETDAAVVAEPVAGGVGSAQAHRFARAQQFRFLDGLSGRVKRVDRVDAAHGCSFFVLRSSFFVRLVLRHEERTTDNEERKECSTTLCYTQ